MNSYWLMRLLKSLPEDLNMAHVIIGNSLVLMNFVTLSESFLYRKCNLNIKICFRMSFVPI